MKDIDIKFIGSRRGERLVEPLWLKEENPTPTEYKKLLKLTNIPSKTFELNTLIQQLEPICSFNPEKPELYRNKDILISLLRKAVPSLDNFYKEEEQFGKRTDMATSVKVVL